MRLGPAAGLIAALLASACATLEPDPTRQMLPATPVPDAMLKPLGRALILRTYSGAFIDHEERNLLGPPDVVVFDDGTVVVADTPTADPPTYRSLRLDADALDELVQDLRAADLDNLAAGGQRDASFCIDCPTVIIRTDVSGDTIEVAAAGLLTTLSAEYVAQLPYPQAVIEVDRLLNRLAERVRNEGVPYFEPVPKIPIAPCMCG